jgi:hypothetical protein
MYRTATQKDPPGKTTFAFRDLPLYIPLKKTKQH